MEGALHGFAPQTSTNEGCDNIEFMMVASLPPPVLTMLVIRWNEVGRKPIFLQAHPAFYFPNTHINTILSEVVPNNLTKKQSHCPLPCYFNFFLMKAFLIKKKGKSSGLWRPVAFGSC